MMRIAFLVGICAMGLSGCAEQQYNVAIERLHNAAMTRYQHDTDAAFQDFQAGKITSHEFDLRMASAQREMEATDNDIVASGKRASAIENAPPSHVNCNTVLYGNTANTNCQ